MDIVSLRASLLRFKKSSSIVVSSLLLILFFNTNQAFAQSCNGFLPGPVTGGLSLPPGGNGDICANTATVSSKLKI
ncbi:MAG TPA: hypothetical protein VFE57_01085, partial [Cyclobacteriaceae bacterium]|nr:hypothetical protein [Cyclobacteriaceae bacterium]